MFPPDNSTVDAPSTLVMIFNEFILESSGDILVFDDSSLEVGPPYRSFACHDILSTQPVTVVRTVPTHSITLKNYTTLSLGLTLASGRAYHVHVAPTAFVSYSRAFFPGIADNITWNFITSGECTSLSTL